MKYFLITVLLVTLFVSCTISRGGGRGGGGGGRGGGWGSSRGGGRIGGGSRGGGYKGSKGYKGGRIKGGTLTKAAAIGAVAYTGYQLGKIRGRFVHWSHAGWRFNDWNRWRMEDGMLCRNDNDCLWIDNGLRCTDYKLDWTMTSEWFNGDTSAIVGTCDCVTAQWWSDDHLQCLDYSSLSGISIFFIVIAAIVGSCISCCLCFLLCKCLRQR